MELVARKPVPCAERADLLAQLSLELRQALESALAVLRIDRFHTLKISA
jgi:hypothetical protein